MDKQKIAEQIGKIEEFVKENVPNSRKLDDAEDYFRHVFGVRKYALKLAEIYGADIFVVEAAALLHDIGADAGKNHAEESAIISKPLLENLNIFKEIVERILKCIELHSMGSITKSIEEQIIQDADGIIFIEDSYKSFFEDKKEKLSLGKAKEETLGKTKGMMGKIKTEAGIKLAKEFLPKAIKDIESA